MTQRFTNRYAAPRSSIWLHLYAAPPLCTQKCKDLILGNSGEFCLIHTMSSILGV